MHDETNDMIMELLASDNEDDHKLGFSLITKESYYEIRDRMIKSEKIKLARCFDLVNKYKKTIYDSN